MSKAYVCDRCGLMTTSAASMHPIYLKSPWVRNIIGESEPEVHLCGECYGQFEREYLANLREAKPDGAK